MLVLRTVSLPDASGDAGLSDLIKMGGIERTDYDPLGGQCDHRRSQIWIFDEQLVASCRVAASKGKGE